VEIKPVLYEVLAAVLVHNWRWFYPSALAARSLSRQDDAAAAAASVERLEYEPQLRGLLSAFVHALQQPDINIFKHALATLQQLNTTAKLYQRAVFRYDFTAPLQGTLLNVLLAKAHELLSEEIHSALYDLAAVDFAIFFHSFLPAYVNSVLPGPSAERMALLTAFSPHETVCGLACAATNPKPTTTNL
jgi:hypothetical protein